MAKEHGEGEDRKEAGGADGDLERLPGLVNPPGRYASLDAWLKYR